MRHRILAAVVLLLAAHGCGAESPSSPPPASATVPRPVAPRTDLSAAERTNIDVFRSVSPAVVHITTTELASNLFSLRVTEVPRGTGSGFMWDTAGHVVTNFHVIQGADRARVTLADQTSYDAELVGIYPDRDIAVLRIKAPKASLKPIVVGRSADLLVGQIVYAIGNPFGLDQTLTTGIVSALDREIESVTRRTIRGVIQTDAAINPGNSGGPLLDSSGRLIGVNTAIYSPSGASAGIGFAIPVDEVNRVVPKLIRDGRIERATLGVSAAPEELNRALRLDPGVALVEVEPGGPAEKAGLEPFRRARGGGIVIGDLITAVDGVKVKNFDEMLDELERHAPGAKVRLTVKRGEAQREVTATLGTR